MVTKILLSIVIVCAFLYTGCDSSKSQSPSKNYTNINFQTMLEHKNYAGVINLLESKAYKNDEYLALGSAYMGLSGLNISDVINKICASNDGESEGSSLMKFTNSVRYDKTKCDVPLSYLNKATGYFMEVIGNKCTSAPETLSNFEREVCVYKGLSQTMEAVTTLNYIKQEGSEATSDIMNNKLKASSCAMEYAFNGSISECSIYEKGTLFFRENNKHYDQITVYTDGREFEFLLTNGKNGTKEVIVTSGYCTLDNYATRVEDSSAESYNSSYHACPINLNEDITKANINNFTTNEFIINSFNEGTKAILAGSDDEELKETINGFKQEIYDSREENTKKSHTIDEEDMIQYLKQQRI